MDLEDIKKRLRDATNIAVDQSFAVFAEGQSDDSAVLVPETFVQWLVDNDVMAADQAKTILPGVLSEPRESTTIRDHDVSVEVHPSSRYPVSSHAKLDKIGEGGMATILSARDPLLRRLVAYKLMAPDVAHNKILAARFLIEAQVTAQLQHPNIVPIYAIVRDPETDALAYTMKQIEGLTLTQVLAEAHAQRNRPGPVEPEYQIDTLLEHFITCCDTIAFAHSRRVLHRDIKPSNIMIGRHHEVYVLDWGLAKVLDDDECGAVDDDATDPIVEVDREDDDKTHMGAVMGTPRYMSPEQGLGLTEVIGPESDQFALGLILYEIVCGQAARPMMDMDDLLIWVNTARTRPLAPLPPIQSIAPELVAIVEKTLQANPGERYEDVADLAADLRRYRANLAVAARPDTPHTTHAALALTASGGDLQCAGRAGGARRDHLRRRHRQDVSRRRGSGRA